MKCKKCGNEVADNSKFCPNCGAAIEVSQEQAVNNPTETTSVKKAKITLNKKTKIIIATALAVVIAVGIWYFNPGKCPIDECFPVPGSATELLAMGTNWEAQYGDDVEFDSGKYNYSYKEGSFVSTSISRKNVSFLGKDGSLFAHGTTDLFWDFGGFSWCHTHSDDESLSQRKREYNALKLYMTRRFGKPTKTEDFYALWKLVDGSSWWIDGEGNDMGIHYGN